MLISCKITPLLNKLTYSVRTTEIQVFLTAVETLGTGNIKIVDTTDRFLYSRQKQTNTVHRNFFDVRDLC